MKKPLARFAAAAVGRLFHKRSIIIISDRRTNHLAVSGPLQFGVFAVVIACVSWASYSTGSYMAAKSVMEEQEQTIKSVASTRIDTNFKYTVANMQSQKGGPSPSTMLPLTDPTYTLAAVNQDKLFARIALLESKVKELRTTNSEIIQTVREKTNNKILNIEEIIRSTGLNPDTLKQEALRLRKGPAARESAESLGGIVPQGGPFIPLDTPSGATTNPAQADLVGRLDQLMLLHGILADMPLGQPLKESRHESGFGRRIDPFTGRLAFHAGMDLVGGERASVLASADGKVISAGWNGAYGNSVDIQHRYGIVTRYGHMSAINVREGDEVKKGQAIGVQGSTGRSTGAHVHYEVRYNGQAIDPSNFINAGNYVSQIN